MARKLSTLDNRQNLNLSTSLKQEAWALCKAKQLTLSQVMRELLEKWVKHTLKEVEADPVKHAKYLAAKKQLEP